MEPRPVRPRTLLNRDFGLYWLGIATSALSDAFVFVALPFLVLDLGGDGRSVATAMVLGSAARFLGPLIGTLADRWRLRLPLALSAAARTLLYGGLGALALAGRLELPWIYAAALLNGVLTTFVFAAGNVVVPGLVPRAELARANSLMQSATMGVPLLGLGVAGALVAALGPGATLLLASPGFLALGLACLFVRLPEPGVGERPSLLRDMAAGATYLLRAGPLALVFPISLLLNASLAMMNVVVPLLMERSGRGATGYGLFETAISVGMLLGILAVTAVGQRLAPQHAIGAAHAAMAAGFAMMGAGGFALQLAGGALLGFGIGFTEVASITLLQLAVPAGMRGKAIGAVITANAFGLTAGAWLAGRLGEALPAATLFGAAAALALATGVAWVVANAAGRGRLERLIERSASAGPGAGARPNAEPA